MPTSPPRNGGRDAAAALPETPRVPEGRRGHDRGRHRRCTFTEEYAASGAPVLPAAYVQSGWARDIFDAARARKDREHIPLWAGQSVGLVSDLPAAADVVRAVVEEARAVLAALAREVSVD